MAIIPQVITEDRASGAQVIDGSLRFDKNKSQRLQFTPSTSGNRRTWTISYWYKNTNFGNTGRQFAAGTSDPDFFMLGYHSLGYIQCTEWNTNWFRTGALVRDTGWYHIVLAWDSTQSTNTERWKFYINGVRQSSWTDSGTDLNYPSQNAEQSVNKASVVHQIGSNTTNSQYTDGHLAQWYFIDGAALGPENFGYTDPLTGTWRPKKYNHRTDLYGVTWSSALVGDAAGFQSAATAADGFNGKVGTANNSYAQNNTGSNPSTITFTPVGGIKFNSSIQVYLINNANTVNVNGEGAQSIAQDEWVTVKSGSGTLNTLVFSRPSTSGASFGGIRIDGHILIDAQNDNSFYLPMDGNSPIGQDQSGNGNDWTPVNFGGSNTIEKATGALPILNTDGGGKTARVGVRDDSTPIPTSLNDGTIWSNYLTTNQSDSQSYCSPGGFFVNPVGSRSGHPPFNGFDGSLSSTTATCEDGVGKTITFTPPSAISYSSSVEVYTTEQPNDIYINGSDTGVDTSANSWVTAASGSGSITSMAFVSNASGNAARFAAIRIDGEVLIDGAHTGVLSLALPLVGTSSDVSTTISSRNAADGGKKFDTWNYKANGEFSADRLSATAVTNGSGFYVRGARGASAGKWYWEMTVTSRPTGVNNGSVTPGIVISSKDLNDGTVPENTTAAWVVNGNDMNFYNNNSSLITDYFTDSRIDQGDVIGFALDMDEGKFWMSHNGTWGTNGSVGNPANGTNPALSSGLKGYVIHPYSTIGADSGTVTITINYGDTSFTYTPPTGFSSFATASAPNDVNKAITVNGDAAASSAQSNFYNGSFVFDGTGDYLTTSSADSFNPSTAFTIEFWTYPNSTNNVTWISSATNNNFYFETYLTNGVYIGDGVANQIGGATAPATGKWSHMAVTFDGTTYKYFLDGIIQQTSTSVMASNTLSSFKIGARSDNTRNFNGYIQDLRVYKGVAKYTSNFIPASTNPDILPDTPSGVTGGSKLAKIIDGAVSFDGSGDSLVCADSADWDFGTGDFTIECFAYFKDTTSVNSTMINRWTDIWTFQIVSSTQNLRFYAGASDNLATASNTIGPNRWYHFAASRSSGILKLFINGVEGASSSFTKSLSGSVPLNIGAENSTQALPTNGFISNVRIVNGTALYTSDFTPPSAPLTDVTNTKLLCCQSNTSATAAAVAPGSITANGNASATNFNPFTTDINAVRGQESGYATLNPLFPNPNGGTYSNGNLRISTAAGNGHYRANVGMSTGKWYWETVPVSGATPGIHGIGNDSVLPSQNPGQSTGSFGYYSATGNKQTSGTDAAYGSTYTYGDVIGCAYDSSNGKIYWSKNGVWQGGGDPVSGTNAAFTSVTSTPYYPIFCAGSSSNTVTVDVNFGQNPFKFPPPEGFLPLTLANLPRPTIVRPDQYVGVTTYTGNSTSSSTLQSFNIGWKPDLLWIKRRSTTDAGHAIYDTVRGTTQRLSSSQTTIFNNEGFFESFDDRGFTVKGDSNNTNNSGDSFVAWTWKAGGSGGGLSFWKDDIGYSTASAAGLTAGTITPTGASVNTKSGFSIVRFTGPGSAGFQSVPHGLGKTPKFIICKDLDNSRNWSVYHPDANTTDVKVLSFISNAVFDSGTATWDISEINSSIFTPYFRDDLGVSYGADNIAYCWAEIPGFSKFGSYTAAGTTYDGPYIECGFRPRWILVKATTRTFGSNWSIIDAERNKGNFSSSGNGTNILYASTSGPEFSSGGAQLDILSNGFKARNNSSDINDTGTYIYAAFAEAPTFNLYGGQANAR